MCLLSEGSQAMQTNRWERALWQFLFAQEEYRVVLVGRGFGHSNSPLVSEFPDPPIQTRELRGKLHIMAIQFPTCLQKRETLGPKGPFEWQGLPSLETSVELPYLHDYMVCPLAFHMNVQVLLAATNVSSWPHQRFRRVRRQAYESMRCNTTAKHLDCYCKLSMFSLLFLITKLIWATSNTDFKISQLDSSKATWSRRTVVVSICGARDVPEPTDRHTSSVLFDIGRHTNLVKLITVLQTPWKTGELLVPQWTIQFVYW